MKRCTGQTTMSTSAKAHPYDGFFSSQSKKTRSPLEETDYEDIFRIAGSSMLFLDLPEPAQPAEKRFRNSSQLDYSNIFSNTIEVAVPLEELLLHNHVSTEPPKQKASEDCNKLRNSSNSEWKQVLSNGSLNDSVDSAQQVNVQVGSILSIHKERKVLPNGSLEESNGSAKQLKVPATVTSSILCEQKSKNELSSLDGEKQFIEPHVSKNSSLPEQKKKPSSDSQNLISKDPPNQLNVPHGGRKSNLLERKELSSKPPELSFVDANHFDELHGSGNSNLSKLKPSSSNGSLNKLNSTEQSHIPNVGKSKPCSNNEDTGKGDEEKRDIINHVTSLEGERFAAPIPEVDNLADKVVLSETQRFDRFNAISGRENLEKECVSGPVFEQNLSKECDLGSPLQESTCQNSTKRYTSNNMLEDFSAVANVKGSSSSPSNISKSRDLDGKNFEQLQGNLSEPATGNYSPIFSDEEIDENSAALAASVKKAMDEAQATLKCAKELMVRKKEHRFHTIKKKVDDEHCLSAKNEPEKLKEEIVFKVSLHQRGKTCHNIPYTWSKMDDHQDCAVFEKGSLSFVGDQRSAATTFENVAKEEYDQSLLEMKAPSTAGNIEVIRMANEVQTACDKYKSEKCCSEEDENLAHGKEGTFITETIYVPPTFQWNFDAETFKSHEVPEEQNDNESEPQSALDSEESNQFHDVLHEFDQEQEQEHENGTQNEIQIEKNGECEHSVLSDHSYNHDIPESISESISVSSKTSQPQVQVETDEGNIVCDSICEHDMQTKNLTDQNTQFEAVECLSSEESSHREKVDNLNEAPIYRWEKDKDMIIETNSDVNIGESGSKDIQEKINSNCADDLVDHCPPQKPEARYFVAQTKLLDKKDDLLMEMCEQAEKQREVDEGEWYEETLEGITITAELKEPDKASCRSDESDAEELHIHRNVQEYDVSETNPICEVNQSDQDIPSNESDMDDENSEISCDERITETVYPDNSEETDEENYDSDTCSDEKNQVEDATSEMEDCMSDELETFSVHEDYESSHSFDERVDLEAGEHSNFSERTSTEESGADTSCQNYSGLKSEENKTKSEFEEGSKNTDEIKEVEKMQRIVVERAIKEARERAFAEVRERAGRANPKGPTKTCSLHQGVDDAKLKSERAAVERATADVRGRALEKMMVDAAAAKCKTSDDKTNSAGDKGNLDAQIRSERIAVEKATADARERAFEKMLSEQAASASRPKSSSDKTQSNTDDSDHGPTISTQPCSSKNSNELNEAYNASTYWKNAALEKHQRTAERAAKALAEKNMRDQLAQKEQAERHRLAETLDTEVKRWSNGKERNLRALLSTLQYILGADSGWQPIPLTDLVSTTSVKKAYRKATLFVHPDKLQQRGASIQQKYTCEKVFDLLKEAWNKFNAEHK